MGGEWVKRTDGSEGLRKYGVRLQGLVMFVLIASSGPQRIDSKFVAGCRSRVGLKICPSALSVECSIKFGVRVWPVRLVALSFLGG